ncbi:(3R)-3-hydroxyacyl-CoA dehydrogenase isoform X3 [Sminthopsis crassicaudata]|uniref:(3R)-3-hydroxyacyl-CoA dehydrogenase isoform X3 n=1 Tax=Sminthopsis crassicaudata TaxID=9301 RepID=UPI003D68C875
MAAQLRLRSALALVTGAGSGIGRAVSLRLAREGALIAASDRNGAEAEETIRLLKVMEKEAGAAPKHHAAFQVDVAEAGAAHGVIEQIQGCFSRPPSVVVSCAGIIRDEFLLRMPEDYWDEVIAVNLKVGNLGQANYAASKAGVDGMTRSVARELGRIHHNTHDKESTTENIGQDNSTNPHGPSGASRGRSLHVTPTESKDTSFPQAVLQSDKGRFKYRMGDQQLYIGETSYMKRVL